MKKSLILSLCAVALAGCESAKRTPYLGGVGEYGYTYDLNNSPSIFRDTSYRPLTSKDFAAPIVVTATNQVAINLINQELTDQNAVPTLSNVVQEVGSSTNTDAVTNPPITPTPTPTTPP